MEPLENVLKDRSDLHVVSGLPESATVPRIPAALASRRRQDANGMSITTSAVVIGEFCIDRNETNGRCLAASWGSPALFVAGLLMEHRGHEVHVSGPYGSDLAPLLRRFPLEHPAEGQRSLSYKNVIETLPAPDGQSASQRRTQYWRPADRALPPVSPPDTWPGADLLYFCPLVPDMARSADIRRIAEMRRSGPATFVLVAQGLMRRSGAEMGGGYKEVLVREIDDDEAATWSCFDLVVFSEDDHPNATAMATRWSGQPAALDTGYVVTQGEHGATLCYRGTSIHFPAARVTKNWNPVGAGDAFGAALGAEFHRAFAVEHMGRLPALKRAVEGANLSASQFVEKALRTRSPDRGGVRRPSTPERARIRTQ